MNYKPIFAILAVGIFSVIFTSFSAYAQTGSTTSHQTEAIVNEQTQITLSGEKSFDPEKESLLFHWEQVSGDPVEISSDSSPEITFTTPPVGSHETKDLKFALTVVDPHGASDISSFTLHVIHVNHPPVVTTQHELTVVELTPVTLMATATDPDNDNMTFLWTQDSGDNVKLSTSTLLTTMFTAPAVGSSNNKTLQFTINADDGNGGTGSDSVTVHVLSASSFNIVSVSCGEIIRGHEGQYAVLTANVTNPGNLPLSYQWEQISGIPVQLKSNNTLSTSALLPIGSGGEEVAFQLIVKQGNTIVGSCEQFVYAAPLEPGKPPVADAGPDQIVQGGQLVHLDGTNSTGSYIQYSWTQIAGEPVTILSPTSATPSFVAPDVAITDTKELTFSLTVSNSFGKDAAVVHITVVHPNLPPTSIIILK